MYILILKWYKGVPFKKVLPFFWECIIYFTLFESSLFIKLVLFSCLLWAGVFTGLNGAHPSLLFSNTSTTYWAENMFGWSIFQTIRFFSKFDSAQHPQPAEKLLYLSYIVVSLVTSLEDSTLVISFSPRSHFLSHFLYFLSLSFSLDPDEPGLLMTISSAHPARIGRAGHAIKDCRKS